ncbi:MAG: hypothetical protein H0U60_03945 [Blastocatellia bacterium]|nr:hypothetical protein [Blastocatellia bacterium]
MRIICDHCDHPISGAVKLLAGNLNLHPDCLAELSKETNIATWGTLQDRQASASKLKRNAGAVREPN